MFSVTVGHEKGWRATIFVVLWLGVLCAVMLPTHPVCPSETDVVLNFNFNLVQIKGNKKIQSACAFLNYSFNSGDHSAR